VISTSGSFFYGSLLGRLHQDVHTRPPSFMLVTLFFWISWFFVASPITLQEAFCMRPKNTINRKEMSPDLFSLPRIGFPFPHKMVIEQF